MTTLAPSADATALFTRNVDPFITHFSFMSPHNARQLSTCTYIAIGSLSVLIWDILCHLRDDYHILFKHRIALPTFVYFLSRLFTLLWLIGYTITGSQRIVYSDIVASTPVGHCNMAIHLATSPLIIALPATELLLFLHVRAIYATERVVVWFFTLLWLCTFVSGIIAAVTTSGALIGPTKYCSPVTFAHINGGTIIITLVNDTLLFIALVARVMGTSTQDADMCQLKDKIKMVLFGVSIPRLAKTLLQNGQQYFLVTIIINLAALVLYYADDENPSLGFSSLTLMNLMASRLYRKTKLTRYDTVDVSFQVADGLRPSQRISFVRSNSRAEESGIVDSVSRSINFNGSEQGAKEQSNSGSPALNHE